MKSQSKEARIDMKTGSRIRYGLGVAVVAAWVATLSFSSSSRAEGEDPIQLKSLPTHSRLSLRVDESVPVELQKKPNGFELRLKGVGLSDLGAPLGEETAWLKQYTGMKDARLASLSIEEKPGYVLVQGTWVHNGGMEAFDFREGSPARWVMDFWPQAAKPAAVKAVHRRQPVKRKVASVEPVIAHGPVAEGMDPTQFCADPLDDERDVFLKLHPAHEALRFSRWIPATTPDSKFHYFKPQTKDRDAQVTRLALDLYNQGKFALAARTVEFLEKEHPQSKFRNEMRFLRANALMKLTLDVQAVEELRSLMADVKKSHVALLSAMFLASRAIDDNRQVEAMETFLWLIQNHPQHELAWVFHLGVAEVLYRQQQVDRALKEYEWVVANAPTEEARSEAALRMGDVYQARHQYEQALASYVRAETYFKTESQHFPALKINKAEALYQLGERSRAATEMRNFLEKWPTHPMGWRATFRLGEIEGRSSGVKSIEQSRAYFLETINRYPSSPGTTLARMRLVACGDHAGLTPEGRQRFFAEDASKYDGGGEVDMAGYRDFRALARVRSLVSMDHDEWSVKGSIEELQGAKDKRVRKLLVALLATCFRRETLRLLHEDKLYDALAFYRRYEGSLPRKEMSLPLDFLVELAGAAGKLGLGSVASQLIQEKDQWASARGVAGANPAPETDAERYARAKALWVGKGVAAAAEVRSLLGAIDAESRFGFERELILGLLDEAENRPASALAHAIQAQLLEPVPAGGTRSLRLHAWIAALQARSGDPNVALEQYRELERRIALRAKTGVAEEEYERQLPPVPKRERVALAQAELLEKLGKWGEVAQVYSKALESGLGGEQAKYGYARALLNTNPDPTTRQKALGLLSELANTKEDSFWKRLATESLANSNFAKEGKKP